MFNPDRFDVDAAREALHSMFPPAHQHSYDPETCLHALMAIHQCCAGDPEMAHVLGERVLFAALRWTSLTRTEADLIIDAFNSLPRKY